jgi:hypothetical protein
MMPPEYSPNPLSPRSRAATIGEGFSSVTPTITAIPPSPASPQKPADFSLPPLAQLNLVVLTEEPQAGDGAGKLLTDELERILRGFSGILDVVGNGLTALETQARPADAGPKIVNGDFDFGSMRDGSEGAKDRLDSLTSSITGAPVGKRN